MKLFLILTNSVLIILLTFQVYFARDQITELRAKLLKIPPKIENTVYILSELKQSKKFCSKEVWCFPLEDKLVCRSTKPDLPEGYFVKLCELNYSKNNN